MNSEETALIEFLHWLEQTILVPNKTKLNFTQHLQRVGKLDEKGVQFIKHMFELADTRNTQINKTLSLEWETINAALTLQIIPEFNAENKIAQEGARKISQHGQRFKRKFKSMDRFTSAQAESVEQQNETEQVAALKASVGA